MTSARTPLVIGHRGAPKAAPQNTPESFAAAVAMGVDGVELDVHLTADGKLAVFHDTLLDATTGGRGPIGRQTQAALRKLRLKKWPAHGISTLDEVLDAMPTGDIELQIELKVDHLGNPYEGMEEKVATCVRARGLEARVILTSFSPAVLECVGEALPGCRRLASLSLTSFAALSGFDAAVRRFTSMPGTILAIHKDVLRHGLVECAAAPGLERTGVWVVNMREELTFWMAAGLRQITTDDPALALAVREATGGAGGRGIEPLGQGGSTGS